MAAAEQTPQNFVKKETVMLIGLACLVIGFLGGIVFSIYKSPGAGPATVATSGQQQAPAPQKLTTEQAQRMLQLEMEVRNNPDNVQAWVNLGHLYFDSDQFLKAISAYDKYLAKNPADADVLTDQGVMFRRSKQPQKAIAAFDKAIEANPQHETARFNKGIVLLYDLNDQKGAVDAWQALVGINPMATAPNGQLVSEIITEMNSGAKQ